MAIELQTLLTIISVGAAVLFGFKNQLRNNDSDIERKSAETAMISQKLDNIGADVSEIKRDITTVRKDVTQLSERVIIVEQSAKSAHHRLDGIEEKTVKKGKKRK